MNEATNKSATMLHRFVLVTVGLLEAAPGRSIAFSVVIIQALAL
jgi:hypothetical protein